MYKVCALISPLFFLSFLPISAVQASDNSSLTGNGINPLSVTRINDRVNYMVSFSANNGKTIQQWHSIDCKQGKAQLLYKDLLNKEGFTTARYYGNNFLRYAPPQDDKKLTAEDIHKICQSPIKNTQWEKLSAIPTLGTTYLVDINSIQHIDDILLVRMGYDYAEIIWEPPYDAPLGLKLEQYIYNCKTHEGAAVAAMNFDSEGRVTDSLITADIMRRKNSFKIDTQMAQHFDQFCQLPEGSTFKAEGHFVPAVNKPASTLMGPSMPDLSENNSQWLDKFPLSVEIDKQAQSLIKPKALPRFKQIRYTQVSALGTVKIQLDAQPDGYIRKLEDYGIWTVQRLTLANQLQLKFAMSISRDASLLNRLQTDLHFPLTADQKYQAQWDSIDSDKKITTSELFCNVIGEGNANRIAPEFSGDYLLVDCRSANNDQLDSNEKLAWLQDFNVFVPVAMQIGDKPESQVKLENVSVIR